MRFIVTNPQEVVEVGIYALTNQIQAGKFEVERDIAHLIYNPCMTAVAEGAVDADITGAFNYKGFWCKDGCLTLLPERLIKYFVVEKETEDNTFLRYNPEYREGWGVVAKRIAGMEEKTFQKHFDSNW